jgi:hypothetical protein
VAEQLGSMLFTTNSDTDLETRIAGKDLAKYIAENYFDDPKEAKAFMDQIDKYIKNSELRDQGYTALHADAEFMKFQPPRDYDRWLTDEKFNKYFGHLDVSRNENGGYTLGEGVSHEDFREAVHAAFQDFFKDANAHYEQNPAPAKSSDVGPTWEEAKEMNCDKRFSMHSEQNKSWYAGFLKKVGNVQNMLNNTNPITDFFSNPKWNIVMNLLK